MLSVRILSAAVVAMYLPAMVIAAETSPKAAAGTTSKYQFAEPEVLVQKAEALAKADIAKMAAAEMVYRNHVFIHGIEPNGGQMLPTYVFMKMYRRFTGYEVTEVERTSSVLRPIKFTIRFDSERVGTRFIKAPKESVESLREAESDNAFSVLDREAIVRAYYCDAQGNLIDGPSPILPRPNYWAKMGDAAYNLTSILDPYNMPQF
jgi:hypothetical protein